MLDGKEKAFVRRNLVTEAQLMASMNASSPESFSLNSFSSDHTSYCIGDIPPRDYRTDGLVSTSGTIWITPQTNTVPWQPSPTVQPYQPYVGGGSYPGIQTNPMFPPLPQPDIFQKDYTVPAHNYEPHHDIYGEYVGCKHCPYANVHKLDPASHPFTIFEEA
jgi:hypothetical protein